MKTFLKLVTTFLLLCLTGQAYSQITIPEPIQYRLNYDQRLPAQTNETQLVYDLNYIKDHCGSRLYGISQHLNTPVRFNERNWGAALECYYDGFGSGAYVHAGRLLNSYKCPTNVAGLGYRQELISYGRLSAGAGIELNYIKYCLPGYTDNKVWVPERTREGGPMPLPLLYVRWGDYLLNAHMLVASKVYLFSITCACWL